MAGQSCNQGRAERLGRAWEAPRSLRQSSVLHKVSLCRMLVVTAYALYAVTALYTEWMHGHCTTELQLEACQHRCTLAESAFAGRTATSLELVGDTPIYDAAERYPVDALRVFIREFHRTYTDESVVCNAGPAERKSVESLPPCNIRPLLSHPSCLPSIMPS